MRVLVKQWYGSEKLDRAAPILEQVIEGQSIVSHMANGFYLVLLDTSPTVVLMTADCAKIDVFSSQKEAYRHYRAAKQLMSEQPSVLNLTWDEWFSGEEFILEN